MYSLCSCNKLLSGGASEEVNKFVETLPRKHKFLNNYQTIILNYFMANKFKNKNVLLLYLAVGRGKTLLSIACGIAGLKSGEFKRVVILSPKSVQDEFNNNLFYYFYFDSNKNKEEATNKVNEYKKYFIMIHYNSWDSYKRFSQLTDLEHTLFIIDEAHLYAKSIIKTNILNTDYAKDFKVNKLKGNCKKINDMIDAVKNKKVLFLTGTPCAKTPFELVPLFNLTSKHKLFVEDYELFNKQYLDFTNMKILHKDQLLNTLDGLIAYVPPITNNDKNNKDYVIVKASPLEIVEVEMSEPQYKQYLRDYSLEKQELGFTNKRNMFGILFGATCSFHAKTFSDCVYYNDSQKENDEYTIDNIHCPKILKMYNDTVNINGLCVFYFRFTNIHGVYAMQLMLESKGYRLPHRNEDILATKDKRYVIFTGDISNNTRDMWKRIYNNPANKHGEYIKYMILSPSGIVGITLHNVRYLGIGSVEFNYSNIRQLLGRVNRLNSHKDLPEKERTLINKIYIMLKNKHYYETHKEEVEEISDRTTYNYSLPCPTIERIIYQDSIKDDIINEKFRKEILIKASITEKLYDSF